MKKVINEYRSLARLAVPVTLSQLALMGMWVTDVILSGRAGTTDLAGVTLGNSVWTLIIYFFLGVCIANQPLIATLFGARNYSGVRHQYYQSLWMAFGLGGVAICCILLGSQCLKYLNTDTGVLSLARNYLEVMALGAMAMTLLPVFRTTLESTNQTRKVLIINMIMFFVNLPLDYALVEGVWGMPRMGGLGCAWASVIILWGSVIITFFIIRRSDHFTPIDNEPLIPEPDMALIRSTLKLGVPIGFSILIELGLFSGAAIVISTLGEAETAAHAVAMNAVSISFMVYMGIGKAITILASQRLGANEQELSSRGIWYGIIMVFILACLVSILFILLRNDIARLYTSDQEVILIATTLLVWAALFQIADATQVTALCGLRAYKDTRSPPRYQLIAFWVIGFPMGFILTFNEQIPAISGVEGFWFSLVVVLMMVSLMLQFKLYRTIKSYR